MVVTNALAPHVPEWLDRAAWPWTPRRFRHPDGEMHYVDEGPVEAKTPPLVLVHGTPTWAFEWRHVLRGLSPERRVLAVDHLGFGLSARPTAAAYSPQAHARRFGDWIDATIPDGPIDLVVHDFGGPIALDWALEHVDRLAHLVIVNTWMWSFANDPVMSRRANFARTRLFRWLYRRFNASQTMIMPSAYGDRRRLTKRIHAQYLNVFPDPDSRERVLYALAQALLGSSEYYDTLWSRRARLVQVPTAILWGVKDSAFQPPILAKWHEALPNARVVRFDGAGHWPHEEEPEAFEAALQAFVAT